MLIIWIEPYIRPLEYNTQYKYTTTFFSQHYFKLISIILNNLLFPFLLGQTKIGRYYGNQGSFLNIGSRDVLYLKFTSDGFYGSKGFKATVVLDDSV